MKSVLVAKALSAAMLCLAAGPVCADYLEGSASWSKPWKELEFDCFTVKVNHAGDMSVTVGGVSISFGQVAGRWHGKNFSTHNNLSGTGPWTDVEGFEQRHGDQVVITVQGLITDMHVKETLRIDTNTLSLVYRWQGEIVDPTPELERIYGHSGALFTWRDKSLNPSFVARPAYGDAVRSRFRDDFGEIPNVRSFFFASRGLDVHLDMSRARNVLFKRASSRPAIPIRFHLTPRGADPAHVMPGATLHYEIRVSIRPNQKRPATVREGR